MTSILASMATARFNALLPERLPEKAGQIALFDCRVWGMPSREEAANGVLWRDAHRSPDLVIERSETLVLDIPPLARLSNRVDVLFDGAEPVAGEPSAGVP